MFGRNKKNQDDGTDFLDLTEKVITLSSENRHLTSERDDLVEANKKLSQEIDQILEGHMALLQEKSHISGASEMKQPVNALMLEALKIAAPCLDRYGKAYQAVENAIKEGEAA